MVVYNYIVRYLYFLGAVRRSVCHRLQLSMLLRQGAEKRNGPSLLAIINKTGDLEPNANVLAAKIAREPPDITRNQNMEKIVEHQKLLQGQQNLFS
jgi:hypothetical protein